MESAKGIIVNEEAGKYEIEVKGLKPFVKFREVGSIIELTHVEVPVSLRNIGVGSGLMQLVMDHLIDAGKIVTPICPFAVDFLKSNPQYRDMTKFN